jgi:phage shock protein PspC (stress-responsive transcriptional regulator)
MPAPDGERTATGWARLPRWQHVALMVLCVVGLVAGIANFLVSDSNRARLLHAAFSVVDGALLVTLITAYLARTAP